MRSKADVQNNAQAAGADVIPKQFCIANVAATAKANRTSGTTLALDYQSAAGAFPKICSYGPM
jgi:hypothetical protein